ncbi:PilZ domain-containing protein [Roseibium algae]|uniref:PilZ domain-containing protein n=1 Tax=Roseibium algae TaxID=3123038 RepID=A0ABU8TKF9_9HYPH
MTTVKSFKTSDGSRHFSRNHCREPAIMKVKNRNYACIIEDISASGCRVAMNTRSIATDMDVSIVVSSPKRCLYGQIRWVNYGEAGIEFYFQD